MSMSSDFEGEIKKGALCFNLWNIRTKIPRKKLDPQIASLVK
jgi:hypothetical protein